MHIEWIKASNFRNFRSLSYSPAAALNILTGSNGQGKTNLLEGIGLLLAGRSFRGARAAELPHWEAEQAMLFGEVKRADGVHGVRRAVSRTEAGLWAITGEGCPWARAIAFGWQDVGIVNGGPEGRRNFLDGFAGKLFPAHLLALGRYRQVLARRNRLLQSGVGGAALVTRLEPWDEQLVRLGLELQERRRRAIEALESEVPRVHAELAGVPGSVRVEYRSALGREETEERFRALLAGGREEERRRGQTLVGPHRDDMLIALDGRDMRSFGSRGQQRVVALALRLAEARPVEAAVGTPALLLLDDALSELDPGTQARVLRRVETMGQVFLTTTDQGLAGARGAWWDVGGGRVVDARREAVRGAA